MFIKGQVISDLPLFLFLSVRWMADGVNGGHLVPAPELVEVVCSCLRESVTTLCRRMEANTVRE